MTRRASSTYVRRKVVEHYAKPHPSQILAKRGRLVMYCGGGHENRGCDLLIEIGKSDWEAEHNLPHYFNGSDDPPNTWPCCKYCHKQKTAEHDAPMIAKSKRINDRHLGIKRPQRLIPGSKGHPYKHKINGGWVKRDE